MKLKLLSVLLFLTWSEIYAQVYPCDSFCVEKIAFDTSFGGHTIVSIHFAGDDEDFINYPHVSAVTNLSGDTLGTSVIDLFGQIGNTTADYHVDTDLEEIPDGFSAIVHFRFDDTVCILSYPCMTTGLSQVFAIPISIYPNPVASIATILLDQNLEPGSAKLYNLQGILVKEIMLTHSDNIELEVKDVVNGMYILIVESGNRFATAKVVVSHLD